MSFTEDELQSFNTILERKLLAHRQEVERTFDQRMNVLLRDLEQRLVGVQQDIVRVMTHKLTDQQNELNMSLSQKLSAHQARVTQVVSHEVDQRQQQQQQQVESLVDRTLAAQLMAIEQLLNQRLALLSVDHTLAGAGEPSPASQLEAIEVQTELSWEDLMEVIGKALDERLAKLNETLQAAVKGWEQQLAVQLHTPRQVETYSEGMNTMQEVFHSIERLEHVVESMQVAMTANHALFSNRLYHHQQLPLERAHPAGQSRVTPPNGAMSGPLSLTSEREEQ